MKTRLSFAIVSAVALIANLTLSVPFLLAAFAFTGVGEVLASPTPWLLFALAVLAQLVGHVIRARKHALLLREIRPIGQAQVFRGQMIGLMFNALLPLRLGELLRAHYVGRTVQISRSAVLATIMFERAIDLAIVAAIGTVPLVATGASLAEPLGRLVLSAWVLCAVLAVVLVVAYRQPRWYLAIVYFVSGLGNQSICDRGRQVAWSFSHALLYALPNRRVLLQYLAASGVMWLAYLASALAVLFGAAAGRPPTSGVSLVALADAPFLGVTTSTGPAFFGAFSPRFSEATSVWLPSQLEVVVFAILAWLLLVVPSVIVGVICLAHRTLVEHSGATVPPALTRSKLFRELDTSREFAHLLSAHFQGEKLGRHVSREEALGHFTVVRPLKGGSHASTLLVWQDGELIVKKVTLSEYRSKLEAQYRWLHERRHLPHIVNVRGQRVGDAFYSIDLEYREQFKPFFEYLHSVTKQDAWAVLRDALEFSRIELYREQQVEDRGEIFARYVSTKILDKVIDASSIAKDISQLMGYSTVVVNGETFDNLLPVLDRIRTNPHAMRDLLDFQDSAVHGDFTIDNLMVDPETKQFMLIDPNDENLIADRVVDFGKMFQSLHSGYEFFLLHDEVHVRANGIDFEERRSAHYAYLYDQCSEYFRETLSPARFRTIVFHEAVHYTRMLTYRAAIDPGTAALYYAIAVRLFNEFLEQYDERPGEVSIAHTNSATSSPRSGVLTAQGV